MRFSTRCQEKHNADIVHIGWQIEYANSMRANLENL